MDDYLDRFNALVSECGPIKVVADAAQVKPIVVFAVGFVFLAGFLLYGLCGQLICNLVGFAFPAFESFKALEHLREAPSDEHPRLNVQFWLTYWVVFAAITLIESLSYYVLVWFPFYYPIKLGLLLWLFLPPARGAETVYRWVVSPVLDKNRKHIDEAIENAVRESKKTLGHAPNMVGGALSAGAVVGAAGLTHVRKSMSKLFDQSTSSSSVSLAADDGTVQYLSAEQNQQPDSVVSISSEAKRD